MSLKTVPGGDGLGDECFGGGNNVGIGQLMHFGIVRFAGNGHKRHQTNTAGDVAAGVLKQTQLLDEAGLAGAHRRQVDRKYVVQDANEDLQPFVFRAPQFVHFQAQMVFLGVVGFLEEPAERPRLGGDAFTGVPHFNAHVVLLSRHRGRDHPTRRRMPDRVRQQVAHDLLHPLRICFRGEVAAKREIDTEEANSAAAHAIEMAVTNDDAVGRQGVIARG